MNKKCRESLVLPWVSSTRLCTLYLLFCPASWAFVQAVPIRIEVTRRSSAERCGWHHFKFKVSMHACQNFTCKPACHLPVYKGETDRNRFLPANVFPSWAANFSIQLTITNFNKSRFQMRFQGNGPTLLLIIHTLARGRVFTWDMKLGVIFQPTSYDFSTKDHN